MKSRIHSGSLHGSRSQLPLKTTLGRNNFTPYDVAEHEVTESIHIVALGKIVPDTPTFAPDDIEEARKLCCVLNAAYNAGADYKGKSDGAIEYVPGYNTLTLNGS